MGEEIRIYEKGLEENPKTNIIFSNLMMIIWIALGVIACRFISQVVGWIYLVFAVVMVYVVLRKLVCTNCYYYDKWCASGWGKLSKLMFEKGDISKFSTSVGVKLAPMVYGILTLIPMIMVVVSIVKGFSAYKLTILILILLISGYSGGIGRKKACEECKMRLICPGCAVK